MSDLKIRDVASTRLDRLDRDRLERSLESERTVVAHEDESAEEVAARFDEADGELVVVVDDAGRAQGVVDPERIRSALGKRRRRTPKGLRESLEELTAEKVGGGTLHHSMRSARPHLHWCAIGEHYVSRRPCRDHEI